MLNNLNTNISRKDTIFLVTVLATYIGIFLSNQVFYLILFFTSVYFYKFKKEIKTNFEKYLVILLPFTFYLVKIYEAVTRNDLLFWDNQYLFHYFRCNLYEESYFLQLTNIFYDCKSTLGFGILSDIISFDNDPWISSLLIFGLISLLISLSLFKITKENIFLITLFLLTPAFRFLILSLNSDIFIILYLLTYFFRKNFKLNILDYLILTIFVQLKIYAIGILFGYFVNTLVSRNIRNAIHSFIILFFNLVLVAIFHVGINAVTTFELGGIPYVFAPLSSFGLFADYLSYKDVQINEILGNFDFLRIFIIFLVLSLVYVYKSKISNLINEIDENLMSIFITITPSVILINLFANHGYKFIFNLLLVFILFKHLNSNQKIATISAIFITPFFYFLNFDYCCRTYIPDLESTLTLFYSRLTFYVMNIIFVQIFFKYSLSKYNSQYL